MRMTTPMFMGALFLGVLGGIFFGLFSCGGYVWHKQLFYAVFLGLLALGVILPPYSAKQIGLRLVAGLGLLVVFAVVEATAACFYLDNPTSWADFKKEFLYHLECEPG